MFTFFVFLSSFFDIIGGGVREKYVGDKLVYVGNKNVGDIFAILCYFFRYNR